MNKAAWRAVRRGAIVGIMAAVCGGAGKPTTLRHVTLPQALLSVGKLDHVAVSHAGLSGRATGHVARIELAGTNFWKDAAAVEEAFGVRLRWATAPDHGLKAAIEPGPGPLATRVAGPVRVDVERRVITLEDGKPKTVHLLVLRWLPGKQLLRARWAPARDTGSTEAAGPATGGECVLGTVEPGRSHDLAGTIRLAWARRWEPVTVDLSSAGPVPVPDSNGVRSIVIDRATAVAVDQRGRSRRVMLAAATPTDRRHFRTYEVRFRLGGVQGDEPPANCRVIDAAGTAHRDFLVQDIRDPQGRQPRLFILDGLRWFSDAQPAKLVLDVPVKVQTQDLDLAGMETLPD